ncbi:hypothetical protein GC167_09450 [bacterium]|nr:hypothetical protein [bacterium]
MKPSLANPMKESDPLNPLWIHPSVRPSVAVVHQGTPLFRLGLNRFSPRFEIGRSLYLSTTDRWGRRVFNDGRGRVLELRQNWWGSCRIQWPEGWKAQLKSFPIAKPQYHLELELGKPHDLRCTLEAYTTTHFKLGIEGSGFASLNRLEWSELTALGMWKLLSTPRKGYTALTQYHPGQTLELEFGGIDSPFKIPNPMFQP